MGLPTADEIKGKWKQHVGAAKITEVKQVR